MNDSFNDVVIYTLRKPDELERVRSDGGTATLREGSRWVAGQKHMKNARQSGSQLAVVFGDATDCWRLTHWAILTNVECDDIGTDYTIRGLQRFQPIRRPQELKVLSTGKFISANDRRPYRICEKPDFLK